MKLPPYQSHSASSKAGAESVAERVSYQEGLVLEAIREHPMVSDWMISQATGLLYNIVPARRGALQEKGLIQFFERAVVNPHSGVRVNAYADIDWQPPKRRKRMKFWTPPRD